MRGGEYGTRAAPATRLVTVKQAAAAEHAAATERLCYGRRVGEAVGLAWLIEESIIIYGGMIRIRPPDGRASWRAWCMVLPP